MTLLRRVQMWVAIAAAIIGMLYYAINIGVNWQKGAAGLRDLVQLWRGVENSPPAPGAETSFQIRSVKSASTVIEGEITIKSWTNTSARVEVPKAIVYLNPEMPGAKGSLLDQLEVGFCYLDGNTWRSRQLVRLPIYPQIIMQSQHAVLKGLAAEVELPPGFSTVSAALSKNWICMSAVLLQGSNRTRVYAHANNAPFRLD